MKFTKVLVQAFIMKRIDYCNSLLYGLPATHINKRQRVQNATARLICSIPRSSHVTPVLYSLHWLPVHFRIDFKILMIAFKAIHGHAPEYICNLIHNENPSMYGLGSNSELLSGPARGFGYTVSWAFLFQVYCIFWSKFGYKVFSFSCSVCLAVLCFSQRSLIKSSRHQRLNFPDPRTQTEHYLPPS